MKRPPRARAELHIGESSVTRRIVGWREWVGLPQLHIPALRAKVDTGARTSALHAVDATPLTLDRTPCVSFAIPEEQIEGVPTVFHTAAVRDRREVKNSGGNIEERFVIAALVQVGTRSFTVEVTLTDRSDMGFPMLLGRNALRIGRFVVHPGRSFLQGMPRA